MNQLNRYLCECDTTETFFDFGSNEKKHPKLSKIAEDLSVPAPQTFVKEYSLCGIMTSGIRNRMHKSLEMRAFLQTNNNILRIKHYFSSK